MARKIPSLDAKLNTYWLSFGALFALFSVILGAFGAHALKDLYNPTQLSWHQTGVQYQMYHAFALIITGFASLQFQSTRLLNIAGICFIIGTIMFSGSLYLLAWTQITLLGAITPIGGLALIIGWILLLLTFITQNPQS